MTKIKRIKIYGERNTGTNYLTQVLQESCIAEILMGNAPRRLTWRIGRRILPPGSTPRRMLWRAEERFEERWLEENFSNHLGWKHSRLDLERLRLLVKPDLGLLLLVKHPYPWLLSLYKRPYVAAPEHQSFENFLSTPLKVLPRHGMLEETCSPIELWNINVRNYLAVLEALPNAHLIKSEDLLHNPAAVIGGLLEEWNVPLKTNLSVDRPSTKEKDKSTADYKDYYLNERWRTKLSTEAYALINACLNNDLANAVGYRLEAST